MTNNKIDFTNNRGEIFSIQELSSGEKILLTLALSLFSAEQKKLLVPKIILLDEIDCCLHPSMIKNLIYLIKDVYVGEYGIKVILITHSPTTVALADEESLFYMTSDDNNRIVKASKNVILQRLAVGIPTLSVAYINLKSVFTESEKDAIYYKDIYEILCSNNKLEDDIKLNFVPSGIKESRNFGDCEAVKKLVESFSHDYNILITIFVE